MGLHKNGGMIKRCADWAGSSEQRTAVTHWSDIQSIVSLCCCRRAVAVSAVVLKTCVVCEPEMDGWMLVVLTCVN